MNVDLESIRLAMFAHPGVKSIHDIRLIDADSGELEVIATIALASPDVDQAVVRSTLAHVLREQVGVCNVELIIEDPGPSTGHASEPRGPLRKS